MNYGHLELRIEELLQEKGISKNMICKELFTESISKTGRKFNL